MSAPVVSTSSLFASKPTPKIINAPSTATAASTSTNSLFASKPIPKIINVPSTSSRPSTSTATNDRPNESRGADINRPALVGPSREQQAKIDKARALDAAVGRPIILQNSGKSIVVNTCQKGNPIIERIKNIQWQYGDIIPDYEVGGTTCLLYLSLRYHRLHPEYIHGRIQKLRDMYNLRILLVRCDVDDNQEVIKELTKVAIINNLTIMIAWSEDEAARYLETYKSFEQKPPDLIKERIDKDFMSQVNSLLTNIKGVNKADVMTLMTTFGSLKRLASATPEELAACPGLGEKKVKRLRDTISHPFVIQSKKDRAANSQAAKHAENGPNLN